MKQELRLGTAGVVRTQKGVEEKRNVDAITNDRTDHKRGRRLMFDNLPPGVSPEDFEADKSEPPVDPDRHYEARIEREMEDH